MRNGHNGHGSNDKDEAGSERPTFEEALAALGEPNDQLGKLAIFSAKQFHTLTDMLVIIQRRLDLLEGEVAKLKAKLSDEVGADRMH